jgi:hypothetical protein
VSSTPSQLYVAWREGDATAGARLVEAMQDWFDAVAMGRLGTERGAAASSRAAERFRAGVTQLRGPTDLVGWSHGLVADEVARDGSRLRLALPERGAEQLHRALARVAPLDRALLEAAYAPGPPTGTEVPAAEVPLRLAAARDALKAALTHEGARFTAAGVHPDHAPLAVYEAGRAGPDEETAIERWLLEDAHARRDVVEFSGWAAALRLGVPTREVEVAPPAAPHPDAAPAGRELSLSPATASRPTVPPWVVLLGVIVCLAAMAAWGLHGG